MPFNHFTYDLLIAAVTFNQIVFYYFSHISPGWSLRFLACSETALLTPEVASSNRALLGKENVLRRQPSADGTRPLDPDTGRSCASEPWGGGAGS